jgi:hypothetical protein
MPSVDIPANKHICSGIELRTPMGEKLGGKVVCADVSRISAGYPRAVSVPTSEIRSRRARLPKAWLLAACLAAAWSAGCSAPPTPGPTPTPAPPTATPALPTPSAIPSSTPNPFPDPVLKITGQDEVVFRWATDRCESLNLPDLAARAFRSASGQVHLILSHYVNYQMTGPDLNHLAVDCNPILSSDFAANPAMFDDSNWIASPYTEDGNTVYALVHNEWRGVGTFGACPSGAFDSCLDTSITMAVSRDGGKSYSREPAPPGNLVATLPYRAADGAGPFGIRNPSNIIKGPDGFYYAFSNISQYQTQQQWVCLMRSGDLSDPHSWRFWDGHGFDGEFIDPYLEVPDSAAAHTCGKLALDDIGASLNDSVSYNTYLGQYVLLGNSADATGGKTVWGWYYSFSDDLVHWTHRKLLAEMPLPWTVADAGSDLSVLYPSLLDPVSDSQNFETSGKTAYLYFTRMNQGQGSLDRDLVRVRVEFFPSP